MKAISIRQPMAGLIVSGIVDVHCVVTRSFATLRGDVAIHASRYFDWYLHDKLLHDPVSALAGHRVGRDDSPLGLPNACYGIGVVLGVVTMVGGVAYEDVPEPSSWHLPDTFGLYVRNPIELWNWVPTNGFIAPWTLREDIAAFVAAEVATKRGHP